MAIFLFVILRVRNLKKMYLTHEIRPFNNITSHTEAFWPTVLLFFTDTKLVKTVMQSFRFRYIVFKLFIWLKLFWDFFWVVFLVQLLLVLRLRRYAIVKFVNEVKHVKSEFVIVHYIVAH